MSRYNKLQHVVILTYQSFGGIFICEGKFHDIPDVFNNSCHRLLISKSHAEPIVFDNL